MPVKQRNLIGLAVAFCLFFAIYLAYPYLLNQIAQWQKSFNLEISGALRAISQNSQQAGVGLVIVSFLYGIFHAVGPGHGKVILSSYLSLEETKMPKMVRITLLSALVQGLVAVVLVTLLVAVLTLSRQHFNLTLKWVERGSFLLMMAIGLYWLWQSLKKLNLRPKKTPTIRKIQNISSISPRPISLNIHHEHSEHCGCGHKHLPSSQEMEKIQDSKSMWLVIFSIGLRPCTGAVLVLFLSYTLDLYWWGVLSAMTMAVGTGLTLTLFAWLVIFARERAVQAGKWYFSIQTNQKLAIAIKMILAIVLVIFGILLFHSSFIEVSQGLLKR